MGSGDSGGSPVKNLQPTHLEELALAYLGIEQLNGEFVAPYTP